MTTFIINIVKLYQFISPSFTSGSCRYYPSCSQYAIDAISKYGPLKGISCALRRISRCHPFHPGGYDPA